MISGKIDVVYERQWRPLPYPVHALQQLGRMGTFYGGFPAKRYISSGIHANIIKTFPVAALWNYALGKLKLPTTLQLEEPKWIGNWVARQSNLADTVWANGTAHRFLFPQLKETGRTLILERGSTHPENFYLRPQLARKEAGYSYNLDLPLEAVDEIEKTKLADGILAASQYVRQSYLDRGTPPDNIFDCSFGIDTETFPYTERAPAVNRPIRVGVVGVIGFRKGLYRILKIGDWAKRKQIPLEFHFAGPIQDQEACEMFATSTAQCIQHGIIKGRALQDMLCSCDLYALPSYEEGLPFSVLEAMSSGLPAIVSNDTGAREPVQEGGGIVLSDFSDDEFDTLLMPVLSDPSHIQKLGQEARKTIENTYSLTEYTRRIQVALSKIQRK